jgi:hypothetical protein
MSEIIDFIKENYVSISVLVCVILILLIIISAIEWKLNLPKSESKLVQQVMVETFDTYDENNIIKEIDNLNLRFTDSFCQSHLGNSEKLEQSCQQLTQDSCQETKCCIWTKSTNNPEKCIAGDQNGPTYTNNLKTMSAYYWQGNKRDVNAL